MEYNPTTEFICSISKNTIYIVSIRDARIAKKFKNFEYFNGNKPYGIVANTNFTSKLHYIIIQQYYIQIYISNHRFSKLHLFYLR